MWSVTAYAAASRSNHSATSPQTPAGSSPATSACRTRRAIPPIHASTRPGIRRAASSISRSSRSAGCGELSINKTTRRPGTGCSAADTSVCQITFSSSLYDGTNTVNPGPSPTDTARNTSGANALCRARLRT